MNPTPAPEPVLVGCSDACGTKIEQSKLESSGWTFLEISKRWRCPACWRELQQVNTRKEQS